MKNTEEKEKAAKVTESFYGEMECGQFSLATLTSKKNPHTKVKQWESEHNSKNFTLDLIPSSINSNSGQISATFVSCKLAACQF